MFPLLHGRRSARRTHHATAPPAAPLPSAAAVRSTRPGCDRRSPELPHPCRMGTAATTAMLDYYAAPGPMTALDASDGLVGLSGDVAGIVRVVQGLLLHEAWAERYGFDIPSERRWESGLRSAGDMLRRVRQLDPGPLE